MHKRLTSIFLFSVVWGASPAANAAEEPLSYAAGGECFCNSQIPTSLENELVNTPIGGQSLTQVCERVGAGPGLKKSAGVYNYPVYDDVQCGNGPGLSGFQALTNSAGMTTDQVGPKWNIEGAYADVDGANTGDSSQFAASSTDGSGAVRFRTRYIKALPSTKAGSSLADSSYQPAKSAGKVNRKATNTEQSNKSPENINSLPLANVVPLEGAASLDAEITPVVKAKPVTEASIFTESGAVAESIGQNSTPQVPVSTAIRKPSGGGESSRNFEYLSVLPVSYDFGGTGVQLSGSAIQNERWRLIGRAGLAEDYQEAMLGVGYIIAPVSAERLTFALTGGVEAGRFNLESGSIQTNSSSTGVFARAISRFSVTRRFELQSGLGYSSFFEGDPHAFGAALYNLTQKLDFIGEFEAGDNDSVGLGIRYNY